MGETLTLVTELMYDVLNKAEAIGTAAASATTTNCKHAYTWAFVCSVCLYNRGENFFSGEGPFERGSPCTVFCVSLTSTQLGSHYFDLIFLLESPYTRNDATTTIATSVRGEREGGRERERCFVICSS